MLISIVCILDNKSGFLAHLTNTNVTVAPTLTLTRTLTLLRGLYST